jgi:hypothetical protein
LERSLTVATLGAMVGNGGHPVADGACLAARRPPLGGAPAASGIGFLVARRLGLWWSAAIVVMTEVFVLLWIRDNLTVTIVMLGIPLESVKNWQTGG